MKRILAMALSATMVLSLAACAFAKASNDNAKAAGEPAAIEELGGMTAGGWSCSESPALTDEQRAVLDKALEGFAGSSITPVAYLGYQVVAGMNHCFLCQATVTYPGAQPKYVLLYVNEALDGGTVSTAVWESGGYSYAVTSDLPLSVEAMTALVAQIS